jgi:SDR family mycofactocin-dependent oxidoreductase
MEISMTAIPANHDSHEARPDSKVAFITGAARGQGRSHAIRLASQGADIIAVDICHQIDSVPYALATPGDLEQTVLEVEALGRRIVAREVDVRDVSELRATFERGVSELGPVDIVLANAGIAPLTVSPAEAEWGDVLDVNLTGVYNTVRVAVPSMIEGDRGGSIVLTSSVAGLGGFAINAVTPGGLAYTAAKHALVGLMRAWANYLAPHNIRVNTVHPTGVRTPMTENQAMADFLAMDSGLGHSLTNALPVAMIDASDISDAIAWLVSDQAKIITGVALPVDAGFINKR